MHAYLLSTNHVIQPFGRPVSETPIHNRTLGAHQEQVLRDLGCTVERIAGTEQVRRLPCLLVHDDVYFSHHALARFVKAARRHCSSDRANARAALRTSALTERFTPGFQGEQVETPGGDACRSYDCYYLTRFDPRLPASRQADVLGVPYRMLKLRQRANLFFEPTGLFVVPISRVFMTPIRHWSAAVTANLLGMTAFVCRTLRKRPWTAATLPARLPWRAGSLRPASLAGKFYVAGRRCRVSPSAHVEGAVLGRGVRIGPNAVVRGAVIGDNAAIGPGAVVEGCTLAQRVSVDSGVTLRGCVAGPGANFGSFFTQFSMLGRNAVLCPESGIFDFRLHGDVEVTLDGKKATSGSRMLGGCLGDRAFLGPGVWVLAGQEVPSDCILVKSPRELVRHVDTGLPDWILRLDARDPRRPVRRRKAS
jgi:carbonic anhydrase/acetyltransferase-like protein (isoleucine patch superfamily)